MQKNYRRYVTGVTDLIEKWHYVRGAHIQAFTFSSQDHGRLPAVLWCAVVVWCGVGWCVFLCFFFVCVSLFSLNSLLFFSCSLFLSFFLSSSFLLLPLFLLSLLFSPPNTVERTDKPIRRPTSRHLNVIWRTAGAQQSVLSLLPSLPLLLEKMRELFIAGIFPARELFFITVLN